MYLHDIKDVLLWCLGMNYAVLLLWAGMIIFAHDGMYRLHSRWFKLSVESFDAIHYAGLALYKIGVITLNLVPFLALWIVL